MTELGDHKARKKSRIKVSGLGSVPFIKRGYIKRVYLGRRQRKSG